MRIGGGPGSAGTKILSTLSLNFNSELIDRRLSSDKYMESSLWVWHTASSESAYLNVVSILQDIIYICKVTLLYGSRLNSSRKAEQRRRHQYRSLRREDSLIGFGSGCLGDKSVSRSHHGTTLSKDFPSCAFNLPCDSTRVSGWRQPPCPSKFF